MPASIRVRSPQRRPLLSGSGPWPRPYYPWDSVSFRLRTRRPPTRQPPTRQPPTRCPPTRVPTDQVPTDQVPTDQVRFQPPPSRAARFTPAQQAEESFPPQNATHFGPAQSQKVTPFPTFKTRPENAQLPVQNNRPNPPARVFHNDINSTDPFISYLKNVQGSSSCKPDSGNTTFSLRAPSVLYAASPSTCRKSVVTVRSRPSFN